MKKITDYQPSCSVVIQYRVGITPGTASSGGGTLAHHEMGHVRIFGEYVTQVDRLISERVENCRCEPCFSAGANFLEVLIGAYVAKDNYYQEQYDCDTYSPGPNRDGHCSRANDLSKEWSRIVAVDLKAALQRLDESCGAR
jgi:hypothetical protein